MTSATLRGNVMRAGRIRPFVIVGVAASGVLPAAAIAQTSPVHYFATNATGTYKLGASPKSELIGAPDGTYFTTTEQGGTPGGCTGGIPGCGTVVQVSGATTSVIYNFPTNDNALRYPIGGLVQGPDGALYGTTMGQPAPVGSGTVFKLTRQGGAWMEKTLHVFTSGHGCSTPIDGAIPTGRLVFGADGLLYGTTSQGGCVIVGTGGSADGNQGTLFRLATDGANYANLHNFAGNLYAADGATPQAGLTLLPNGLLYGTTHFGGTANAGTVFRFDPSTRAVTVLHSFSGALPDGGVPLGALALGADGLLWGTTYSGSGNDASYNGSVFKLAPAAPNAIISYIFPTGGTYSQPQAGLFQAGDGNFYGTTGNGGFYDITPTGTINNIYQFPSANTTTAPVAMPLQGHTGTIYMTTANGGPESSGYSDRGAIYKYAAPLPKPAPAIDFLLPTNGAVGTSVVIGGANFVGASKVTFKGTTTPATFTVNASGFITAQVPTGATTGRIRVTTPGGAVISPAAFAVP